MTPALTRGRERGTRAFLRALFLCSGIYVRVPFSGGIRTNDSGAALFQSRRRGIETHLTRDTMAESVKLDGAGQLHGRLGPLVWFVTFGRNTSAAAMTALLGAGPKTRGLGPPLRI